MFGNVEKLVPFSLISFVRSENSKKWYKFVGVN